MQPIKQRKCFGVLLRSAFSGDAHPTDHGTAVNLVIVLTVHIDWIRFPGAERMRAHLVTQARLLHRPYVSSSCRGNRGKHYLSTFALLRERKTVGFVRNTGHKHSSVLCTSSLTSLCDPKPPLPEPLPLGAPRLHGQHPKLSIIHAWQGLLTHPSQFSSSLSGGGRRKCFVGAFDQQTRSWLAMLQFHKAEAWVSSTSLTWSKSRLSGVDVHPRCGCITPVTSVLNSGDGCV